jgi:hypothetical protein
MGAWCYGQTRDDGRPTEGVLDRAGVKAGAVDLRLNGLDERVMPQAPDYKKSFRVSSRIAENGVSFLLRVLWPQAARIGPACSAGRVTLL